MNNSELDNLIKNKWKTDKVWEESFSEDYRPGYCIFNNTAYALDLLYKHVKNNSKMCFHTDVDVDGIGTTYIFKKTLEKIGSNNHLLLINRDKVHGIQQKHADYFKQKPIDLMIITDSSSNEIDIIKQFNCDVLCIDHHDLLHRDLLGYCNDGIHRYVIVNNTIDNYAFDFDKRWLMTKKPGIFDNVEPYKGTSAMSCGLVVYELLRIFCDIYGYTHLLENMKLYQWVGVTLISDVIDTLNDRNQWYLDKTVFSYEVEPTLDCIMHKINKYISKLSVSYIGYTFAPLVNKAIRANAGAEALTDIIYYPDRILDLKKYDENQKDAVDRAINIEIVHNGVKTTGKRDFSNSDSIELDITSLGINPNYTGVIASHVGGDNNKAAAVYYIDKEGLCKGSFRGQDKNFDYRGYFEKFDPSIYAQGHSLAFGFRLKKDLLDQIMKNIPELENKNKNIYDIALGQCKNGIIHIDQEDWDNFRRQGYLMRISVGNSKVQTNDQILFRISNRDIDLKTAHGKLLIYNVFGGIDNGGFECKAFKPVTDSEVNVLSTVDNGIEMFIH